jgi:hypothetical protein
MRSHERTDNEVFAAMVRDLIALGRESLRTIEQVMQNAQAVRLDSETDLRRGITTLEDAAERFVKFAIVKVQA